MKKESNHHIQRIIDLYINSEFPQEMQDAVLRWLVSPVHAEEKDRALEDAFDRIEPDDADTETYESLQNVRMKVGLPVKIIPGNNERHKFSLLSIRLLKIAAVLIPLLFITVFTYRQFEKPVNQINEEIIVEGPRMIRISVPSTEVADKEAILADGSAVYIKPGSTITYAENFEETREVELTGMASFDVVGIEGNRPFVVSTEHLTATVLGTEFSVEAYSEKEYTEVRLNDGRLMVRITGKNAEGTIMEPGDILSYDHNTGNMTVSKAVKAKIDVKTPKTTIVTEKADLTPLIIDDMSILQIFNLIEKHYNVTVEVDAILDDDERYDITFREGESLENTMSILKELTGNWQYSIEGNKITITK